MENILFMLLMAVLFALIIGLFFAFGVVLGSSGKLHTKDNKNRTETKTTDKTVAEKKAVKEWKKFLQYDGSTPQEVIDR